MSEEARTTVSSDSMRIWWWLRLAIRDSADSGSPCDPVETSTTLDAGRCSTSFMSIISPSGTRR